MLGRICAGCRPRLRERRHGKHLRHPTWRFLWFTSRRAKWSMVRKGNDVIAHELFHQWFGDLVTCESWSNLPLNESFATYGEYLWLEYKEGRTAADQHHWQSRQGHLRSQQDATPIRF
jgi:aminopeptidase N